MISYILKAKKYLKLLPRMQYQLDLIQQSLGRIELRQIQNQEINSIQDSEFKVSSQWGEDGIIQYLLSKIPINNKVFIEFGVENYTESNTRFLLQNNQWSGLVIDGSEENINYIKNDKIYWSSNLKAVCSFVDIDNINELFLNNGVSGDIGILSIDIDGNDYWVWNAINCISPRIVICEYNSLFGNKHCITIPYNKDFVRSDAHYSLLYYGASICALEKLGMKKGYSLVGSNSAGNNAFFVRDDLIGDLNVIGAEKAYMNASFRESHNKRGELIFLDGANALKLIADELVVDIENDVIVKISDLKQ